MVFRTALPLGSGVLWKFRPAAEGKIKFNNLLWNGEYYVQKYDQVMEKKYQYGEGYLSDQMLGQWLAMVAGGEQTLKEFIFTLAPTGQAKKLVALKGEAGGKPFQPRFKQEETRIKVTWDQPLVLKAGEKLSFRTEF